MKEIEQVYHNDFGIAFYWIKEKETITDRIQVVFKDVGLYLQHCELRKFKYIVETACIEHKCNTCIYNNSCRKVLLKTPSDTIDLAVTYKELINIKDLLNGTLFNLQVSSYISELCKN